ncbi:hypothetical protein [Streptomyces sp. WAC01280]|uniref:hypothetical protein n=1 Tax=Streptomyces sp. WAC01280 TaxID=2487424 RepID=UPI000F7ADC7A|nr:hypothetical protein [Streptomyces sp. WAC01280]RSS51390.1 hypothetical protein EF909_34420 [Streptomyces sp. WAC01280]
MRDALALGVLVLLLLGTSTALVGAVCVATVGARAVRRFFFPAPRVRLVRVVPAPLRYVWVTCDTARCAHLQTRHYPAGPGLVACHDCGTVRPRP